MAEEQLDLLQLSDGGAAELRADHSQVTRRAAVNAGARLQ